MVVLPMIACMVARSNESIWNAPINTAVTIAIKSAIMVLNIEDYTSLVTKTNYCVNTEYGDSYIYWQLLGKINS